MKYRLKNSFHKKFVAIVLAFLLISTFSPIIENMIYAASSITIGTNPSTSAVASSKLYGKGTNISPFEIYKYEDLLLMESKINNGDTNYNSTTTYYTLMNNIDCSYAIKPIGSANNPFIAEFNGNGFTITYSKIYFSGVVSDLSLGLFGYNEGTIKNLTVSGSLSVACTKSINNFYWGGICGYNMGTIENCTSDTSISITDSRSNTYLGGIVGYSEKSLYNCTNKNTISCSSNNVSNSNKLTYNVGGISGHSQIGLYNCFNYGNITGNSASETYVGGISGYITFGQNISTCFSKGTITSLGLKEAYAGGIIGGSNYSYTSVIKISDCYNENNITSGTTASNTKTTYAGGIIGNCYGFDILNVYNIGNISSTSKNYDCYAGGIVGRSNTGSIKNAYFTGTITANGYDFQEKEDIWRVPYQYEMKNESEDERFWYNSAVFNYSGRSSDYLFLCEYSHYVRTFNPIVGHSENKVDFLGTVKYVNATIHESSFKSLELSLTHTRSGGYIGNGEGSGLGFSLSVTSPSKNNYSITVKNGKNKTIYNDSFSTIKPDDAIYVDDMPKIDIDTYQYQQCINLNHYPGEPERIFYFWQTIKGYALKYTSSEVRIGFDCMLYGGKNYGMTQEGSSSHRCSFYSWAYDYPANKEIEGAYPSGKWNLNIDAKTIFAPVSTINGSTNGIYRFYGENTNVNYTAGKTSLSNLTNDQNVVDFGDGFKKEAGELPKLVAFNW